MEHTEKKLNIELKFFMDDLEICMINDNLPIMLFGTDKENRDAKEHLTQYVKSHFKIKVNNSTQQYDFNHFKASKNCYEEPCNPDLMTVSCFLEIDDLSDINNIEIYSDLIVDQYPDHKLVCKFKSQSKSDNFVLDESHKFKKLIL